MIIIGRESPIIVIAKLTVDSELAVTGSGSTSMFEVGDRIRTNRSAAIRYGVIDAVEPDGSVMGEFDDGLRFVRIPEMLDDLAHATDRQS